MPAEHAWPMDSMCKQCTKYMRGNNNGENGYGVDWACPLKFSKDVTNAVLLYRIYGPKP